MSRTVAASLVLAATLTLGGCGIERAGAAAVVAGREISVTDVQQAHTELVQALGATGGAAAALSQQQVLSWLVYEQAITAEASERGVPVSADDAVRRLTEVTGEPAPDLGESTLAALRALVAQVRLTGELPPDQAQAAVASLRERMAATDVEVNPRYGRFDPQVLAVVPDEVPWIATPRPPALPGAVPPP